MTSFPSAPHNIPMPAPRLIQPHGSLINPATYTSIREPIRVLSADPPWQPGDNLPGKGRGASKKYLTMPTREIRALPLPPLHKDAILFLWRISCMVPDAMEVVDTWGHERWCPKHFTQRDVQTHGDMRMWADKGCPCKKGFTPKGDWCWNKLTKHGKPWFAMGHYSRASKEILIVATRGKFSVDDNNFRDAFSAKVPWYEEGDQIPDGHEVGDYIHSAKPPEFYALVEKLAGGGPYAELFGRKRRPGWFVAGNDLPALQGAA